MGLQSILTASVPLQMAPVLAAHPLALALAPLFADCFDGLDHELLLVAGCDRRGTLLVMGEGTGGRGAVPSVLPALRAALAPPGVELLVMAHNHPDGTVEPSRADKDATRGAAALARLAGAQLADHLLFANGQHVSFRQMGIV